MWKRCLSYWNDYHIVALVNVHRFILEYGSIRDILGECIKDNNRRLATRAVQVLHVTLGLFVLLNVCLQAYDLWFLCIKR